MKRSILENFSSVFSRRKSRAPGNSPVNTEPGAGREASNKTGSEKVAFTGEDNRSRDWIYVGNDEEGTPIYLDRSRMARPSGSASARVWLKHIPSERARSFEQAQSYLRETGLEWASFCYMEQLLELDLNRNFVSDITLLFFDRSGRLIEQVQFQESTYRPLSKEAFWSAIKEMVAPRNIQPDNQPEPASDQPSIEERIELKLQEINSVLEAFDTCGETENAGTAKAPKS